MKCHKYRNSVKLSMIIIGSILTNISIAQNDTWTDTYAYLLQKYVKNNGVNYAAWKNNSQDIAAIRSVTDVIAARQPLYQPAEQLAFYINAYNAWILRLVLEKYPTKGVLSGDKLFFHKKKIVVDGQKMSLNFLEKDLILKKHKEARVHFALNCASVSCPPLLNRPFRAETLESDFNNLTKDFLNNNPLAVRRMADGSYHITELFKWYKDDFARAAGSPLAFINRYRAQKIPSNTKIKYLNYDWNLNAAR